MGREASEMLMVREVASVGVWVWVSEKKAQSEEGWQRKKEMVWRAGKGGWECRIAWRRQWRSLVRLGFEAAMGERAGSDY